MKIPDVPCPRAPQPQDSGAFRSSSHEARSAAPHQRHCRSHPGRAPAGHQRGHGRAVARFAHVRRRGRSLCHGSADPGDPAGAVPGAGHRGGDRDHPDPGRASTPAGQAHGLGRAGCQHLGRPAGRRVAALRQPHDAGLAERAPRRRGPRCPLHAVARARADVRGLQPHDGQHPAGASARARHPVRHGVHARRAPAAVGGADARRRHPGLGRHGPLRVCRGLRGQPGIGPGSAPLAVAPPHEPGAGAGRLVAAADAGARPGAAHRRARCVAGDGLPHRLHGLAGHGGPHGSGGAGHPGLHAAGP